MLKNPPQHTIRIASGIEYMQIEGPLIIAVQEDESSLKRELHLSFKPGFKQQTATQRIESLQDYMDRLKQNLQQLESGNADRMGMETVHHICENLLQYLRSDEIDLNETIAIEIQPPISIASILSGGLTVNCKIIRTMLRIVHNPGLLTPVSG